MDVVAEHLPDWIQLLWSTLKMNNQTVEVGNSDSTLPVADENNRADRAAWKRASSSVIFAEAIGFLVAHVPFSNTCMDKVVQLFRGSVCSSSGEQQCGALLALSKWGLFEKQLNCENPAEQSHRLQHLQATRM